MRLIASAVKEAARGKWAFIFNQLAGDALHLAMKAASGKGRDTHVACPIHGGKDGFRLFKDWQETGAGICNTCGCFKDGFALLQAIRKEGFYQTLTAVAGVLGLTQGECVTQAVPYTRPEPTSTLAPTPTPEELKNSKERKAAERVWKAAIPFTTEHSEEISVLRSYLKHRGLSFSNVNELRFLPRAKTKSKGKVVEYPAMIGAIRDNEGNLVSVHRTFLTPEGWKAPIEVPKKIMTLSEMDSISGCAIKFGKPDRVLALAEGIETALSVVKATGFACWSCVSAGGLKSIQVPSSVKTVLIFEDKDLSGAGEKAAQALKTRLEADGLTVHVVVPSMPLEEGVKSVDFNDIWQALGKEGFPFVRG